MKLVKYIGVGLMGLGYLTWFLAGGFGLFWSFAFIAGWLGFFAALLSLFIFPATLFGIPAMIGFATGEWSVAIIVYGGAVLGMVVMGVGSVLAGID